MAVSPKARQAAVAIRRNQLIQYRLEGRPYADIYEELGYSSRCAASKDFSRALEENLAEQHASMEVHRHAEILRLDAELARLSRLYARVEAILDRHHVTVSNGRVVLLDGETIEDDVPVLHAVDRLVRIEEARRKNGERRAKLLGLEAPQRVEVLTLDAIDAQIRDLNEQLAATDGEAPETAGAEATSE